MGASTSSQQGVSSSQCPFNRGDNFFYMSYSVNTPLSSVNWIFTDTL